MYLAFQMKHHHRPNGEANLKTTITVVYYSVQLVARQQRHAPVKDILDIADGRNTYIRKFAKCFVLELTGIFNGEGIFVRRRQYHADIVAPHTLHVPSQQNPLSQSVRRASQLHILLTVWRVNNSTLPW